MKKYSTLIVSVLIMLLIASPTMAIPEYYITPGATITVDPHPQGLVYRDDGFWVTKSGTTHAEDRLQHYSLDGDFLGEYEVPGSINRYGVAWDGSYWWLADNNYGPETIYKCELNIAENRLDPVQSYTWLYTGPGVLEWANGFLWVADSHTDIIYRVSVGDTSLSPEEWSSANVAPSGLAWDGTNMWSSSGPSGGGLSGPREIYKHGANGNIIEIWHYPPADDPDLGSYGGYASGIAFVGNQLYYTDGDKDQIIEAVPEPATFLLFGLGGLALRRKHRA